jgi:hypothetical protein
MTKKFFSDESLSSFVNAIRKYTDNAADTKADLDHAHDNRYYTETEIDTKLSEAKNYTDTVASGKADSNHNHDKNYDTKGSADAALASAQTYTDTKVSGLASTSTVDTKISTHNTSTAAHNDIRVLIAGLTTKLNNFLDVDDTTTDQLSEVITLINNNKGTLESLTTSKVNVSDIINNLTTNNASKVLSAAQGVLIKGLIDALQAELDSHTHTIADVSGLQTALDGKAASSHGTHVSYSTTVPVMDGTASVGTSASVARSDHKHPTDTSRAAKTDLDTLSSTVAGKANASHTHAISEVTSLQSSLDAKANTSHTHTVANISDLTATAAELNYMDGVTGNVQTQLNKKANDFSIEIYNGTGGNPKPVKFLTVNYSTCGSENGVAIKIGMVSGHGNGTSYAFLQDAIIRVAHTGGVEVDNFKYYGADTGTYDGANRQYGDIFWLIDTTNKVVDFYCLMGQYARIQMTPYKRVTYSTGGTITQHTSCAVYSSGTKVWANNGVLALSNEHYTKAEMDNIVNTLNTAIGGKAASIHTHDDRYYTEAEINAKVDALNAAINGKAPSNHTHSNMIVKLNSGSTEGTNMFTYNGGTAKTVNITPASIGAQVAGSYAAASHAHDDKYYTETEIDSKINTLNTAISGKAASSHTHSISNVTNLQSTLDSKSDSGHTHNYAGSSSAGGAATSANKVNSSMTVQLNGGTTEGTNMFTFNGSATKAMNITPSAIGAAASSHSHDDKYYTEAEIDSKLSGKANASHGNHVPATETANNAKFLRNDNTWQTVTPANIGAAASSHNHDSTYLKNAVFYATYGTTKFSDILAAHNAGRIVMMTSMNISSYLASATLSAAVVGNVSSNSATFDFAFVDNFGRAVRVSNKVDSNNTWSNLYMATPSLNRTTNLNASDTNYTTLMARGTSLNSSTTSPAVNGAIAWTYS